ncbi:NAD(P)-binding protein [Dentipellis sp. KUC8613]|nr:NAD(P)-binding protein [Dentipellis sp. KUC8613]
MSSNIQTVLVTGASGFLGSVVVDELLAAGYKVRSKLLMKYMSSISTARSGKAPRVQAAYASFGDRFQIVVVDDLATDDLTEAFKGVDALIHVGSPLAGKAPTDILIKSAVEGTLHAVEGALKAGVKKIVVTASILTLASPAQIHTPITIGASDWSNETQESAAAAGPLEIYAFGKTLAEKALWDFAAKHPELDVATVHPGFLYGPPGHGQVLDKPVDGTNGYVYQLISGPTGRPVPAQGLTAATHVRDAALLHVLALKAAPSPASKPKRIVAIGPEGTFTWLQAVKWLHEARPELRARLPTVTGKETHNLDEWAKWDSSSAKEIVGLEKFRGWKEMVGDSIDGALKKEKELGIVPVQ